MFYPDEMVRDPQTRSNSPLQEGTVSPTFVAVFEQIAQNSSSYPNFSFLMHVANWYNLFGNPELPIQLSQDLKWQVLAVTQARVDFSSLCNGAFNPNKINACVPFEDFQPQYLTLDDLVLLYRMLMSFLNEETANQRFLDTTSSIGRMHVALLGDLILDLCYQDRANIPKLLDAIERQGDPFNLEGIQLRIKKYSMLFSRFSEGDKYDTVLAYFNDFYAHMGEMPDWEMELEFYCFLKAADKVCPELQIFSHFFDFGNGILVSTASNLPGMEILRNHFNTKEKDKEKYHGKLGDVQMDIVTEFANRLKALEASDFQGIQKFVILNGGPLMGAVGGHYDPVFVKREGDKIRIVITDSGAFDKADPETKRVTPSYWLPVLIHYIHLANLKNVEIYAFQNARQSDNLSCAMTTWRDILESCKFDIFAYVDQIDPNDITVKTVELMAEAFPDRENTVSVNVIMSDYPARFMKVKQSTSYVSKYEKSYTSAKTEIVASKTIQRGGETVRIEKTLRQVVEAHTIQPEGKKVNFYLRQKCYKYFGIILTELVQRRKSISES